ncbi:tyrosine-protein phosphatase [Pseudohongiella spirulinae]|uniref:Tyrosine specific protein phosphatases domain-containing protein n=1 Tax=Pseudohongiella spirulinae TaxID=1249552 RepID=A0A0S2KAL3_9GAMM|nr:tyrosine-protein phosphatase [Pseudohongiella spirulinae]ALO45010.1 hypothetical protein PS2015_320 [Pseudohongiella spirulinae]
MMRKLYNRLPPRLMAVWGGCLLSALLGLSAMAATPAERALIERHLILLEGGRNFRDLGGFQTQDGKTVKSGMLFRSGVLHHLTDDDYRALESLGIATVVDLRSTEERSSEPTHWQASPVKMMTWDYDMGLGDDGELLADFMKPDLDAAEAERLMGDMYRNMVTEQRPHYADMFAELASRDEPLLFHCSAGKDRTGIAAALLLIALGVDRETAILDYTLSEVIASLPEYQGSAPALNEPADNNYEFLSRMPEAALSALMGTRRSYIETAFDEMSRQYGSVDNYISQALQLSAQDLATLRANFLE